MINTVAALFITIAMIAAPHRDPVVLFADYLARFLFHEPVRRFLRQPLRPYLHQPQPVQRRFRVPFRQFHGPEHPDQPRLLQLQQPERHDPLQRKHFFRADQPEHRQFLRRDDQPQHWCHHQPLRGSSERSDEPFHRQHDDPQHGLDDQPLHRHGDPD